jgi:ribonucleoside-diphosphate reductase alpha chain
MACRIAGALGDNEEHRRRVKALILRMFFLFAGRVQRAVGSPSKVTPYNCFVSGIILDDSVSIMDRAKEAFLTMRMGGGIGFDFSRLRWRGAPIASQAGSPASGAVSFMEIFNAVCSTVSSAGNRRGAMMSVLRVDHPDIQEFITIKRDLTKLTKFNLSVAITDEFMAAAKADEDFDLKFEGKVVSTVRAAPLWDTIMRTTWDYAEPGAIFIDTINKMNNLHYCETIEATNPCAEQPLPPYGACLLGSSNIARYVVRQGGRTFIDVAQIEADVMTATRALDNVIDGAEYPLPQQKVEAISKRRMGIGVTGMANAVEACGRPYGTDAYIDLQNKVMATIRDAAYTASALLAEEKGAFELYDRDKYLDGLFINTLPAEVRDLIATHGIRNSHLLSVAPTGTISMSADNVSSGIEPVFAYEVDRTVITEDGTSVVRVTDYGFKEFGVRGRLADELTPEEHVDVLIAAQQYVDSAVSKTCNVGDDVSWERFKGLYERAHDGGAKGCTTFRAAGKRYGVLNKVDDQAVALDSGDEDQAIACEYDPATGIKTCDE